MSKSFIFNMGYDTSHITSVLAHEGLPENSKICLITPGRPDDRQQNAIDDVQNYLDSLDIECSLEVFSAGKDVRTDMGEFLSLFDEFENTVLSLSGGSRDVLIPLTVAATVSPAEIESIYFRSDIDSQLELVELPRLRIDLDETEKRIVSALEEAPGDVEDVAERAGMSESTVYRRKDKLEEKGLVRLEDKGKTEIEITSIGRFFLQD